MTALAGLITGQFGQSVEVSSQGQVYRAFVRKGVSVVVGDEVRFLHAPNETVVTQCLARRNVLARRDRYHPVKSIAANIDQVLVMMAVYPELNEFYLDAYLAGARAQGFDVAVAVNKIDLAAAKATSFKDLLAYYEKLSPVFCISVKEKLGLGALTGYLKDKVTLLLGPSGVGKSSLLNTLLGRDNVRVAAVSSATDKGQHTTSGAAYYALAFGGALIDTPGIREFHSPQGVEIISGFGEFQPFISQCEFRNCNHLNARGCALMKAVEDGQIAPWRLKNYYRLLGLSE